MANATPRILVMGATGQVGKGDVLDVISKKGLHRLREVTVFTTVTGALPDEVTQGGIHQAALPVARSGRALALRIETKAARGTLRSARPTLAGYVVDARPGPKTN
ncbi:MAG TPA: hypothetical protein VE641_00385 [Chthoniobacterales bacterium]|nr:hypothetical protein [Chthoniobacterales bacterium]